MSKYLSMDDAHHCALSNPTDVPVRRAFAVSAVLQMKKIFQWLLTAPIALVSLKPLNVSAERHLQPAGKSRIRTFDSSF
jgi:hypothetical protein